MDIKLTRLNILETWFFVVVHAKVCIVYSLRPILEMKRGGLLSFYRYETKSEFRMISTSKLTKRIYIYIRRKLRGYRKNESG